MHLRYGEIDQNINEITCPKTYVMVCGSFTQRGYGGVPTTWKARIAFTRYQNKFAFNHQLHQGTIHKGRPQNFRDSGPPPPLVHILARSIRVNPRNLPYYVCFWATPLPPSRCGRPLCMAP